jgi:zinc/manganese transport system substrate-binding protein
MKKTIFRMHAAVAFLALAVMTAGVPPACAADVLRVFATTPDLASLAREVGGDRVDVVEMVKGREDPHFAEARPSFIKELSRADLYVQVGLELEAGYAPLLLDGARNAAVLPGGPGFVDASRAITPLDIPKGPVDRSMGDVHAAGSPHYLLDPVRGFEVATLLATRMSELRPADADHFRSRLDAFRTRLASALAGEAMAARYDALKLAELAGRGGLAAFLDAQGDRAALGGWLGTMLPLAGTKVVDDHAVWSYFAARFGLVVVGHLEPKPGIPPTTAHLRSVIERMKADGVRAVIASPYYDPRHARLVAEATGAKMIELAHQTGGRDGAATWIDMIDYNVRTTAATLSAPR